MTKISMFLMNLKGYYTLKNYVEHFDSNHIEAVVSCRDKNIEYDFYDEIKAVCKNYNIAFYDRKETFKLESSYSFAIGWRWLIEEVKNLIVFHDSLLPRYRGFAPLVTCLLNKEEKIGVTALFASNEYDRGDIISQKSIEIQYPIKISEAIEKVSKLYFDLVHDITIKIYEKREIVAYKQNEKDSSYSLWRDSNDYIIDWNWDSEYIKRFIDAVGSPYLGALTFCDERQVRVREAIVVPDVIIENRNVGKVIFVKGDFPIIVCGSGLLMIQEAIDDITKESILPLSKFKVRFRSV